MRKQMNRMMRTGLLGLVLALSACAPIIQGDKPIAHWTPDMLRSLPEDIAGDRSTELLVFLAFSGGGTRAAAFSYGLLHALANTEVASDKGTHPLIKEIDVISSVSGGSFTSAYYGLYGNRIFEDYEKRFLRRNVEKALILKLLNPVNWARLMTPGYDSGDMAAHYYGKTIFDDATFADLKRPDAPLVVINATDLPSGLRISFSDRLFGMLCTDLDAFPVSRAVAASSAVPVLFNPIILKNYAGTCGFETPPWLEAAAHQDKDTIARDTAKKFLMLDDSKKRPYLHLVDGGVSDNLGLRSIYTLVKLVGNPREAFRQMGHPNVRQVLIISVNSQTKSIPPWASKLEAPGIVEVLSSVTDDQIAAYTADTLDAINYTFKDRVRSISTPEKPVTFHFVEVSFDKAADEAERQKLNDIDTSFNLKDEEVDLLISAAAEILRRSPEFKAFLDANNQLR